MFVLKNGGTGVVSSVEGNGTSIGEKNQAEQHIKNRDRFIEPRQYKRSNRI